MALETQTHTSGCPLSITPIHQTSINANNDRKRKIRANEMTQQAKRTYHQAHQPEFDP